MLDLLEDLLLGEDGVLLEALVGEGGLEGALLDLLGVDVVGHGKVDVAELEQLGVLEHNVEEVLPGEGVLPQTLLILSSTATWAESDMSRNLERTANGAELVEKVLGID